MKLIFGNYTTKFNGRDTKVIVETDHIEHAYVSMKPMSGADHIKTATFTFISGTTVIVLWPDDEKELVDAISGTNSGVNDYSPE